jgi:hypothetical protein
MDRVDQDENKYQAELDAKDTRAEDVEFKEIMHAKLKALCVKLYEEDLYGVDVSLAMDAFITTCGRANAAVKQGKRKLYDSISHLSLKDGVIGQMILDQTYHRTALYEEAYNYANGIIESMKGDKGE